MSVFPTREADCVQLGHGSSPTVSHEVWGARSVLCRVLSEPEMLWSSLPKSDWVGLYTPLACRSEYRINGLSLNRGDVFFADGRCEVATQGRGRDVLTLNLRRDALEAACAGLAGRPSQAVGDGHRVIEAGARGVAWLERIFRLAVDAARSQGQIDGRLAMPRAVEVDAIGAIADWLLKRSARPASSVRDGTDPWRVVRAAMDAARAGRPDEIGMADLCASAGVGKSRLHACFVEVLGVAPGRYLLDRRLTGAREWLADPEAPPPSVKAAALSHGFLNNGRFARAYFDKFAELPRQTLDAAARNEPTTGP